MWILSGVGLLLVILGVLVFFMRGRQSDLRDFSWGMTREQVKQHESALLESEKDDALIYRTTLFEYLVAQGYYFTNGKLSKVQYVSLSKQKELKLSEYLKIRAELEPSLWAGSRNPAWWISRNLLEYFSGANYVAVLPRTSCLGLTISTMTAYFLSCKEQQVMMKITF